MQVPAIGPSWFALASLTLGLAPALGAASRARLRSAQGDVVQPEIIVPGEWLTDEADSFLFLPLDVPRDIPPDQCKIMSNGESILVIVTEKPQDEPETNAMKKYKLIVEAIRDEVRDNEGLLKSKLQTWMDTEEDDEVIVLIRAALESLVEVHMAKKNTTPRAISVPLGLLEAPAPGEEVARALPALRRLARATSRQNGGGVQASGSLREKIIRESFSVQIPYPVPKEQVFVVRTRPTALVVGMPLARQTLEAKGVSTGGKPFVRVPMFGEEGLLAGPNADMKQLARGLDVHSLAVQAGLKPLIVDKA